MNWTLAIAVSTTALVIGCRHDANESRSSNATSAAISREHGRHTADEDCFADSGDNTPSSDTPPADIQAPMTREELLEEVTRPLPSEAGTVECPVATALKRPAVPRPGQDVENDAIDAIFLFMFERRASGPDGPKVYFISVDGGDPNEQLLARFADHRPLVKRKSDSEFGKGGIVLDKGDGEQGILFKVSVIRWLAHNEVVVEAEDWTGNMAAGGSRYLLKRINGKWTFTASFVFWVS